MPVAHAKVSLHAGPMRVAWDRLALYGVVVSAVYVDSLATVQHFFLKCSAAEADAGVAKRVFRNIVAGWRKFKIVPASSNVDYALLSAATYRKAIVGTKQIKGSGKSVEAKEKADPAQCWFCASHTPLRQSIASVITSTTNIDMFTERFRFQLICAKCGERVAKGERAAALAHASPVGIHFLKVAQAHEHRDLTGVAAVDNMLFTSLQFQQTSMAEPYRGRTSREALAAAAAENTVDAKLTALFKNYLYVKGRDARQERLARMRTAPALSATQPIDQYLSNMLEVDPFMLPFYLVLAMCLKLLDHRRSECLDLIKRHWTTRWGGGRVINQQAPLRRRVHGAGVAWR